MLSNIAILETTNKRGAAVRMEIIRRSPVALVFKIIIAELLIELSYTVVSLGVTQFQEPLGTSYQSVRVLLALLFGGFGVYVLAFLIAQWANEGYSLDSNELTVTQGIIKKTKVSYPFANMQSVTVRQGLIGRVFNFGYITIFIPTLGKEVVFSEISNPNQFAERIKSHIPYPENGAFLIRK